MRTNPFYFVLALLIGLGLAGCTTVVTETAQKAWEDRSTEDQVTDTKIGAGILKRLADRDEGLLLDVSTDVWEQRVLLTGVLDNAAEKKAVEGLVGADDRIKRLYSHVKVVSKAEKESRRADAKAKDSQDKSGVGQAVNDFWIETKIKAQLLVEKGVTSVNYRWRSVLNEAYVIGRAGSTAERDTVLRIIRATEGVEKVRSYIEVKPVAK